ncbi:hypothetical protein [Nocardioides sp. Leaf285]|uniref:hypothetical protein n=1 Tax=Nocardioides sp. Leaf285 TaxID=1736322 RepID=UPI0007027244|nr:hypothetical protein [Nocardioides sp. Leaf285]KQP63121.1 hypothetical protein ASF47_19115 [Nocardioides sp. Leaf285]
MADQQEQSDVDLIIDRSWRDRVWFWKPQWHWWGWRTLVPVFRGGDQHNWHTICLGWTITGRVIIATRPCPGTGRCDDGPRPDMERP